MIESFEKRIPPGYLFGIPKTALPYLALSFAFVLGIFIAEGIYKTTIAILGFCLLTHRTYELWVNYKNLLIKKSMELGKEMKSLPTFTSKDIKVYSDKFGWKTWMRLSLDNKVKSSVDFIINHDGSVSLAFIWSGVHNRYFNTHEHQDSIQKRSFLLKQLGEKKGLFVENHLLRKSDTRLIDSYLTKRERLYKEHSVPKIVKDVCQGIADLYRGYARSNTIITVFSLPTRNSLDFKLEFIPKSLKSWLLPTTGKRNENYQEAGYQLLEIFKSVENNFPGAKLLSKDLYQRFIQATINPYTEARSIDWRFLMNQQLIIEKPTWEEKLKCLKVENTYYKTCLLQGYPGMYFDWVFLLAEANIDLHISQIINVKDTQKSLDKNQKVTNLEKGAANEKKSLDSLIARFKDLAQFRKYVADLDLNVIDNAYIVTFYAKNTNLLDSSFKQFKSSVGEKGGIVRDDQDLQFDLFRTRLPGLGRSTGFLREDHSHTVSVMMPFTTYPTGSKDPECIRLAETGNVVGFSPSKLTVAHELVVAETEGGKDTQYGIKILETWLWVRYDIIEKGNSHQGEIEAIGGHYCRAREQVINPLMSYEDFGRAKRIIQDDKDTEHKTLESNTIEAQIMSLCPIFKGMKSEGFTKAEDVVMGRLLRNIYTVEHTEIAPTLPDLLKGFDYIEIEKDSISKARDELAEALYLFLETETGSAFKETDQFFISPIANAIDFDKFQGPLADFFLTFMCTRMANDAFTRGKRSQIVLNEYAVLLEQSPDTIRWITLTIDRMGRKDWVGLTRISQGYKEIKAVDSEVASSIKNMTLLSRADQHEMIGNTLRMPETAINYWKNFKRPESDGKLSFRESFVCENEQWHHLYLKFPDIALKLMNTNAKDKSIRDKAYTLSKDPYERIKIIDKLKKSQSEEKDAALPLI